MSASDELTISQSAFEGLFRRVLNPQGAFLEELKQVGYDPAHERASYSLQVWDAALKTAARHVHPGVPREEALRRLGEAFLGGFFETLTGKLVSAALPLMGGDTLLKQLPRAWAVAAPGTVIDARQEAPGRWELVVRHPSPQPDFDVGLLTALMRRVRAQGASIQLVDPRPDGYTMQVRWTAGG
jgi:uncharacterized protein (TIGR02265 family)